MAATDWPLRAALKRILPETWRATLRRVSHEPVFLLWRFTFGRGKRLARPIFMIGCSRSGTTLAAGLFGLHPDVADFSEAHEIWDPRHYRDPEADHHWTSAQATQAEAIRLHARFEYVRRYLGKERFFNKNPRSSVRIDYIRAVFPDAVFVHVIRDGRAVVASMLEFMRARAHLENTPMPFCRPPEWRALLRADKTEQGALQWCAIVRHVLSKKAELGPVYHEFRYEELCQDPRGVLAPAFRFAGLRADAEVLANLPERLDSQNYKWREQLTPAQIGTVNRVEAPLLEQLGYPL